jgi:tetratricopeptide (TPR) repeat protein
MKKTFTLLLILISSLGSFTQPNYEDPNLIDKAKIQVKLADGKQKLYSNNYRGALLVFREVLAVDGNNSTANYRIAECHFGLNQFDKALKYATTAEKLDPKVDKELPFLLAECNHRLENLDIAKEQYLKFKTTLSVNKAKEYAINQLIAQTDYAKEAMKNPVDVIIENLGSKINTTNPEYSASVSSDGKTLIFTSRRSDTKGGRVDEEFDHQYYEDVYISTWNEELNEWAESESIEGRLNSEFHDACLNISPDGSYIYVYRNIPRATKSGDIYISKQSKKGNWGTPKAISKGKNINSSYFESSASITEDEETLFFVSDRPGGKGVADIYMAKKEGRNWGEPVNLGDSINTDLDEKFVFVHPNGKILFFSSQGHDNLGGYDIFVSHLVDGKWRKPKNLGYPINTVGEEKTFSITKDGKTAYIASFYEDTKGGSDIYKIDISKLNLIKE